MEVKKEFLTEIKTEPIDYQFEYSEYNGERVVGVVEIGQEFKTEPTYSSETPSTDHMKITEGNDSSLRKTGNHTYKHESHFEDQLVSLKNRGKNHHLSHLGGNLKFCGQSQSAKRKYKLKYFPCDHCEYVTDIKSSLSRHIRAKHLPRNPSLNKCKKCGKSYSQRSSLLRHLKICGQSEDLKRSLIRLNCDHCNYETNYKSSLSTHMQEKHLPRNPNSNKCKKCGKSYSSRSHLLRHLKLCGLSEDLKNSLMRLNCDHCKYKTFYKSDITRHMQSKHLPRNPNLNKCNKCGKSYSTRSNLLQHLKLCGKPEDLKRSLLRLNCDHCKYKTDYKSSLSRHMQAKHLPLDPNLNECNKCGNSYSKRSHLLQHSRVCGQPEDLKRLLLRLNCDHCKYKTDLKSHLSDHIQAKHLPRDPNSNKCEKCGKSYSQRSSLLRHLKLCGQSKNLKNLSMCFNCDNCKYKTFYKSDITRHMQAKHLPRDPNLNKCKKCGKSYCNRSYSMKHSCGTPLNDRKRLSGLRRNGTGRSK